MSESKATETESSPARRLLEAAGLQPSDQELAIFAALYPLLRARADVIFAEDLGDRG